MKKTLNTKSSNAIMQPLPANVREIFYNPEKRSELELRHKKDMPQCTLGEYCMKNGATLINDGLISDKPYVRSVGRPRMNDAPPGEAITLLVKIPAELHKTLRVKAAENATTMSYETTKALEAYFEKTR